jgi:hypothetical protein
MGRTGKQTGELVGFSDIVYYFFVFVPPFAVAGDFGAQN